MYWFGICYWIQFVLAVYGGVGNAGGWAVFMLFCLAKALHMAVFALLAGFCMRSLWAVPATAALWVAIELTHGYLGFAWLALGNAGIDMGLPMRLAPITGVYGISFVFAMLAAALALAFLRRPRRELAWLVVLPALFLLPSCRPAPAVRDLPCWCSRTSRKPRSGRSNPPTACSSVRLTLSLAGRPDEPRATETRLIVWPEVPAPLYYNEDARFRGRVNDSGASG